MSTSSRSLPRELPSDSDVVALPDAQPVAMTGSGRELDGAPTPPGLAKHSKSQASVRDLNSLDSSKQSNGDSTNSLTEPLLGKDGGQPSALDKYVGRSYYGAGTPGAELKEGTYTWRILACISQVKSSASPTSCWCEMKDSALLIVALGTSRCGILLR